MVLPSFHDAIARLIEFIESYAFSGEEPSLSRVEIEISRCEAMPILVGGGSPEKFYWSDRDRTFEWAGFGTTLNVVGPQSEFDIATERMNEVLNAAEGVRFFGGMRFDPAHQKSDATWDKFPDFCFVLPTVDISNEATHSKVGFNLSRRSPEEIEKAKSVLLDLLKVSRTSKAHEIGGLIRESRAMSEPVWREKVSQSLDLLVGGALDKIVLANAHDFFFEANVDPAVLLFHLDQKSPATYRFLMQLSHEDAFLGASPEQLFARDGLRVESEAQAGTRPRGSSEDEDAALAAELLKSEKEFAEHEIVIQDIEKNLSELCRDSGWVDQRKVIKLRHVQHLRSRYGGILKDRVADADILKALHPTSAVCGRPKQLAQSTIRELEEFDRGYYCGPIGLISKKRTELAVALRSALTSGNQVRVFAGAGLVEGSSAEGEWNEIDSKMRLYYEVFRK